VMFAGERQAGKGDYRVGRAGLKNRDGRADQHKVSNPARGQRPLDGAREQDG